MTVRHVIILASRRSGSTAFWRLFRRLPGYTAYDEPFNPLLNKLPRDNRNATRGELIELYNTDPRGFRSRFAPVTSEQETTPGMTDEQRTYLAWLLDQGPAVLDITRCHAKIPDVHAVAPDAAFIHLYRRPASFLTSHLMPTNGLGNHPLREWWRGWTFFTRRSGFNKWHLEELLTGTYADGTRQLLERQGVRLPDRDATAAEHLMAYWLGCYRLAEREGRRSYGERFVSVDFEAFCEDPEGASGPVRDALGDPAAALDFSRLRTPRPGFRPDEPRWRELADQVGFTSEEVDRLLD